jgi:hypothetical protein
MKKLLVLFLFVTPFCSAQNGDFKNKITSVEQIVTDIAYPKTLKPNTTVIKTVGFHKENGDLFVVGFYKNDKLTKLYFVDVSNSNLSEIFAVKMTEDKLKTFIKDNNFVTL